jgi:hypothetical protein
MWLTILIVVVVLALLAGFIRFLREPARKI